MSDVELERFPLTSGLPIQNDYHSKLIKEWMSISGHVFSLWELVPTFHRVIQFEEFQLAIVVQ